jgi:hypothetical protein
MIGNTPPQLDDIAVREDDFETEDVIAGNAIFQAVHPTRVRSHIAANRRHHLTAGVGDIGVAIAIVGKVLLQVLVDHTRLDHGQTIRRIDLQDAIHARQFNHQAAVHRNSAAANSRASTSSDVRGIVLVTPHDELGNLLRRLRQHHSQHITAAKHRGVVAVDRTLRP